MSDGLIGMGPSWLSSGDRVMLVRGAIVPYTFRHVDDDLRLQAEKLKKEMEKLEKRLLAQKQSTDDKEQQAAMGTRKEIAKLRRKLIQAEGQIGRKDGWILIGGNEQQCGILQMGQDSIDTRDLDTLLLLNIRIHYLPVVNHHSPATGPAVVRPSELLREARIRVGQEEHVFFHTVGLSPSAHDKRIVGSHDSHHINTFTLDFGKTLQITREMLNRARRCECSGNREKDDFLIGPFLRGVIGDRDAA